MHSNRVVEQNLSKLRLKFLSNPTHFPYQGPSEHQSSIKLKMFQKGRKFESSEGLIEEVNDYFGSLEETYFREKIAKLEKFWGKCTKLHEDN